VWRTAIFRDDADRADFVTRVAAVAAQGAWTVHAWALLPNHAHLLVRTGTRPLPRSMRSLLTGYAGAFNRRHHRVGHLFQNRYKSVVVEGEPYLRELVRYLHLNALRAKGIPDLRTRDRYPWTRHSAVLGTVPRPWQATRTVLAQFGPTTARARAGIAYCGVEVLGHPGRPLAGALGVSPQAVYQAVARGRATRRAWEGVLAR
jgi:REP element-mobilizing transposase RayT